jgi:HSP90 family molecular chaperone
MLTDLIKKYSEFINFPIKLKIFKEVSKEVEDEEATAAAEEEEK